MSTLTIAEAFKEALQHHQAGRLGDAERLYRQILSQEPTHADALHLLGRMAQAAGDHAAAVDLLGRAVASRPDFAEAIFHLGMELTATGQHEQALEAYRRVLALEPGSPFAYSNMAGVLRQMGRLDESLHAAQLALKSAPNFPDAHNNLGVTLRQMGKLREAAAAFRRAIALNPNYAEAYSNLGGALVELGQMEEAMRACQRSIAINGNMPEAYCNFAGAAKEAGQLDQAIAACQKAITLKGDFAEAYNNLGAALMDRGRTKEAVAAFRQASICKPMFADAHHNLGMALLRDGDYLSGWEEYEWRWRVVAFPSPRRNFAQKLWEGEPLDGETILLHTEQGFGDSLQFLRYVPLVRQRAAKVVVECAVELERLVLLSDEGLTVIRQGNLLPHFDVHCPLLSLPRAFATTLQTIPADVPYLRAEAAEVEQWRGRFGADSTQLKVGLAWAGSPVHGKNRSRSMALRQFEPLLRLQGARFFSLQKDRSQTPAQANVPLIDVMSEITDFAGTAALIANLDLVIAVDTAVVHLAGAMGKRVWVLASFAADWRWLEGRVDSPWYPSVRLFRQPAAGDWDSVMAQAASELRGLIGDRARNDAR